MNNQAEAPDVTTAQIRDARDLLTRLYREIGISAVAAALEIGKERPHAAHLAVESLPAHASRQTQTMTRAA